MPNQLTGGVAVTGTKSYVDYLESLSKKQLMVMLARQRQQATQGISIVGMGCRFPGGIDSPDEFWALVRDGRTVPTASASGPRDSRGRPRWNLQAPDLAPMAEALRRGCYLDDVDVFDAAYFGISDEEARYIDPQHRLLLEVSVEALADANIPRSAIRGRSVGIFVGLSVLEYPDGSLRNGIRPDDLSPFMVTGYLQSAGAGRLGLALGVSGPAMVLDTASSSALVAVHLASQSLRSKECDVAIVGASHLLLLPYSTAVLAKAGALSPTGRCRPFSADADGYVRAEGCGVLILKRQRDAEEDGSLVYATIRGTSVFQHGGRPGLAAMSGLGQRTAIQSALRAAGVEPHEVQYVEAQANGSRLGGVIEAEAIAEALQRDSADAPPLYIGSCKSNLGYLETASGVAGLMKTALALSRAEIPPQAGLGTPDPDVAWDRTALRFASAPVPWSATKRIAGVNAIGVAGTHAHVLMEAPPARPCAAAPPSAPVLLALSAHKVRALAGTAARLHRALVRDEGWVPSTVCRTLSVARDTEDVRFAVVVRDRDDVLRALESASSERKTPQRARAAKGPGSVILLLPDADSDELRSALAEAARPGLEALSARIRARAPALGIEDDPCSAVGTSARMSKCGLAWALGWIDWLALLNIKIAGSTIGKGWPGALVDALTASSPCDDASAHAADRDKSAVARPTAGIGRDNSNPGSALPAVQAAQVDAASCLALVGDLFCSGASVHLPALWAPQPSALCRLPSPKLAGTSHWLDANTWP